MDQFIFFGYNTRDIKKSFFQINLYVVTYGKFVVLTAETVISSLS